MGQFLGGTGKIAVVSSAIASENNNYYVQVRETEFADFIHKEYPDIEIITTLDSFEDPQITYEKTVKLLRDYQDLQGIYITCGGVSQVGRALEESGRAKDIRVISFEDYPEVVDSSERMLSTVRLPESSSSRARYRYRSSWIIWYSARNPNSSRFLPIFAYW